MLFKNYLKSIFAYILTLSLNTAIGLCCEYTEDYETEASFTHKANAIFPEIKVKPREYTEKRDTWDFDIMLLRERSNPNTENYLDLLADVAIQSEALPTPDNSPCNAESNFIFSTVEPKRRENTKTYKKKNIFKANRPGTFAIKSNNQGTRRIFVIHEKSSKSPTISALSSMNKNQNKALNIYTRQLGTRIKKKTKLFSLSSTKGKTYIFN